VTKCKFVHYPDADTEAIHVWWILTCWHPAHTSQFIKTL